MEGGWQRLYSLLLLGLFAGHFCAQDPASTAKRLNISELEEGTAAMTTKDSPSPVSDVKTMNQERPHEPVQVYPVPSSLFTLEGHSAFLTCRFNGPENVSVTWRKSCYPNCSRGFNVSSTNPTITVGNDVSNLTFEQAKTGDSGMYYCIVTSSQDSDQSCGTYLWVRRPHPTSFLNIRESVKNKIITAEGFLLLICAIGPGLFLLLRKRWENESLIQAKKKYEEENLYEGLNLDECSMYEDISRGLQATYQDIGNVKVIDLQLEKPEKP
ncbi:B-cell antigen receptor complex-associated protein alpha chain [Heteronotia binoei]|uniref:B-cell antigen receptor complex-associated protein alpha chain n=1 Tax=Heteronotia binoei TaxID=13085 RepID=UPI00292CEE2E|nr:B-cell antigen receptor complex-associated protein alpha chain [Heteronotia binoei]